MLGDGDRHHRKLFDLMTRRLADAHTAGLAKDMSAVARGRPMLDDLVDRPRRQQRPALALMPRLRALPRPDRSLPRFGGEPGRSAPAAATRTRRPPNLTLKPHDPLILRRDTLLQTLDLLVHSQQDRHDGFYRPWS